MNFFDLLQQETAAEREYLLGAPIIQQAMAGTVSLPSYVAFLTQAYHHVKHTVPLLMACGARLPERLEWLREAIAEYIEEEYGHQEWILNDIRACGADAGRRRPRAGPGALAGAAQAPARRVAPARGDGPCPRPLHRVRRAALGGRGPRPARPGRSGSTSKPC